MIDNKYKQIDKDSHKYFSQLSQIYSDTEKKDVEKIICILKKCQYYIQKTEVINAPHVLKKGNTQCVPLYENWERFDKLWRKEVGDEYKTEEKGKLIYSLKTDEIKKKWDRFCEKQLPIPKNQIKNSHAKVRKYTMNSLTGTSGTTFRINRQGKDIYQSVPLDNKEVDKDHCNFLIKHSKNLTLISNPDSIVEALKKPINAEEEFILDNEKIDIEQFINKEFIEKIGNKAKNIKVKLNNTTALIENFPLDKFKSFIVNFNKDKTSIELLTESKEENSDKDRIYAKKGEVDALIKVRTRPGSITKITVEENGSLVDFTLPFEKENIKRFYDKLPKEK